MTGSTTSFTSARELDGVAHQLREHRAFIGSLERCVELGFHVVRHTEVHRRHASPPVVEVFYRTRRHGRHTLGVVLGEEQHGLFAYTGAAGYAASYTWPSDGASIQCSPALIYDSMIGLELGLE